MATRTAANSRRRDDQQDVREIGFGWPVENPPRRKRCLADLRTFLKTYFPRSFRLAWSADQLRVISKIEEASRTGGLFALAMPRGSGKTTITERAALWCILAGLHRFVLIVAATEERGKQNLEKIKRELRRNDLLSRDFPEACHPIRALANEGRRCIGQLWLGTQTEIGWGKTQLVFPKAPEGITTHCAGSCISVAGMTSAIRGHSELLPNGETIRPSFLLVDDPQTRESAESDAQCASREAIIAGDVLGAAGPDDLVSAVMPCTVIRAGDMADRLLDRSKHPDWNGERMKMVYSFPTNQKLWDEYGEIRAASLREGRGMKEATAFYRKNRTLMDAGCEVAWKQRKRPDELSAIQSAMNLMLRDKGAFMAEYQNEPMETKSETDRLPTADEIIAKLSGIPRSTVAVEWSHVVASIDVQKEMLYFAVTAWAKNCTGGVIQYGAFPDQGRPYFSYSDLTVPLSSKFPGMSPESTLFAGLQALVNALCSQQWQRQDGTTLRIERCLIDSGYETDLIYQFVRQSSHAAVITPSKGYGVSASNKPMSEYQKRPGEIVGNDWRLGVADGRHTRHVLFDSNSWKSHLFSRLGVPMGSAGCLSLFGHDASVHRLLADHLTAEFAVKTFGRGRDVTEFKHKPGRPDNHLLDCLTGCCVAAAMQGCGVTGETQPAFRPRKERIPLSQMGRR